mgnify:CR=1 FL=1
MSEPTTCECLLCCDGDHPGRCRECAGWGERDGEHCERCDGGGLCPVCDGAAAKCRECLDEGYVFGSPCRDCGETTMEEHEQS